MQFKVMLPPGCSWTCCGFIVGTGVKTGLLDCTGVELGRITGGEGEGEGAMDGCGVGGGGGGGDGGIAREGKTYGHIPAHAWSLIHSIGICSHTVKLKVASLFSSFQCCSFHPFCKAGVSSSVTSSKACDRQQ